MSYVVHWLSRPFINETLACGRSATLRVDKLGRFYETPLYAILDHGREGRWCKACLRKRRSQDARSGKPE
jgi:hypothetical protein